MAENIKAVLGEDEDEGSLRTTKDSTRGEDIFELFLVLLDWIGQSYFVGTLCRSYKNCTFFFFLEMFFKIKKGYIECKN